MMIDPHNKQPANGTHQAKPNGYPAKAKPADPPHRSLYDVCLALRDKLDAFLAEEPERPILRNVQERLRVSMGLVEQALRKYPYVFILSTSPPAEA